MLGQSICLGLCAVSASAFAATPAIPAAIKARVEQVARTHVIKLSRDAALVDPVVTVTLMPRGAIEACAQAVAVEALDTRYITRMRFTVACNAGTPWRTEVVVRGAVKASVLVATTDLPAGRPIDLQQLGVAQRDVANAADVFSDPLQAAGKTPRRVIRSGQIVSRRALLEPILVTRGDRVTVVARKLGIEVQFVAETLQAGHRDEIIEVRNVATGKILRARVTGENLLELVNDMPTSSAPP